MKAVKILVDFVSYLTTSVKKNSVCESVSLDFFWKCVKYAYS